MITVFTNTLSHTILNKNKSIKSQNLHNHQQATITRLAQLEERSTFNRVVVGSIPTSGVLFAQVPFGLHPFCWLLTLVFLLTLTPKKRGARDSCRSTYSSYRSIMIRSFCSPSGPLPPIITLSITTSTFTASTVVESGIMLCCSFSCSPSLSLTPLSSLPTITVVFDSSTFKIYIIDYDFSSS